MISRAVFSLFNSKSFSMIIFRVDNKNKQKTANDRTQTEVTEFDFKLSIKKNERILQ